MSAKSELGRRFRLALRRLQRTDARIRDRYLASAGCSKLQIGGGWRRLDGWLNCDLELAADILRLDATRPFPFADGAFQFVFTEHMVEHVDYAGAQAMLRECRRVLRPGGVIRVVTPDLNALTALAAPCRSPAQQAYFDYFVRSHLPPGQPPTFAAVANTLFRAWGHRFIYDETTLRRLLEEAGFAGVVRRSLGQSDHEELTGIEHEARYPPGLLDYESLALEATR